MKTSTHILPLAAALLLQTANCSAALLSHFSFNSTPLITASAGPSGSGINSTVLTNSTGLYFSSGGATTGVDLVVPYSFNCGSIQIEISFAKNENSAVFFERGGMLIEMSGGAITWTYRVYRAHGSSSEQMTCGPTAVLPNDGNGQFKSYVFQYDAISGIATIYREGNIIASYAGPAGRSLHWGGAGDGTIGAIMDGGGNGFVFLDDFKIYDNIMPLPVELVAFRARRLPGGVELYWKTATESDNYGFEVQRSDDGNHWKTLGFIAGAGTSNSPKEYRYSDRIPASPAALRYRLKQIDRDGSCSMSEILTVASTSLEALRIDISPNPTTGNSTLFAELENDESVAVSLHDFLGREVIRVLDNALLQRGIHAIRLPVEELPPGSYFCRLFTASSERITRVVVLGR